VCSREVRWDTWGCGAEKIEEEEERDLVERRAVLVKFGGWGIG
jgi:hypothetical protein